MNITQAILLPGGGDSNRKMAESAAIFCGNFGMDKGDVGDGVGMTVRNYDAMRPASTPSAAAAKPRMMLAAI